MEPRRRPASPLHRPPAISWQPVGPDAASQRQLQVQRQFISRQLAEQRYHQSLRVASLGPVRPAATRQDGDLAQQAQAGARAQRQYAQALSATHTREVAEARRWRQLLAQPVVPTAVIRQAEHLPAGEQDRRRQQAELQQAYAKYQQNVELISGEYPPWCSTTPSSRPRRRPGWW